METDLPTGYSEYNVSVFHKGIPLNLVTLNERSEEDALRRAKRTIWMVALKDGREFEMEDLHTELFHGEVPE